MGSGTFDSATPLTAEQRLQRVGQLFDIVTGGATVAGGLVLENQ